MRLQEVGSEAIIKQFDWFQVCIILQKMAWPPNAGSTPGKYSKLQNIKFFQACNVLGFLMSVNLIISESIKMHSEFCNRSSSCSLGGSCICRHVVIFVACSCSVEGL